MEFPSSMQGYPTYSTSSILEDGVGQSFPFTIPVGKALEMQSQGHPSYPTNPNGQNWTEDDNDGGRRTSPPSSTLYVGDLPILCDDEKLFNLFHHFGKIEVIQLKKNPSDLQRNHLSYGFIRFASYESAVRALEEVNGFPFYGRNLRLGWAEDRDRGSHHFQRNQAVDVLPSKKNFPPTAQIHVAFISKNVAQQISELDLRRVFQQFGHVVDVEIKKSNFNQDSDVQSGYGFVRFALTEEGVNSALTAIDFVNCKIIQGTSFKCTATHGLNTYLLSMRQRQLRQQTVWNKPGFSIHYPDRIEPFSCEQGNRPQVMNDSRLRPLLHPVSAGTMDYSQVNSISGVYNPTLSRMSEYSTPIIHSPTLPIPTNHSSPPLLNEAHLLSPYSQFGLF